MTAHLSRRRLIGLAAAGAVLGRRPAAAQRVTGRTPTAQNKARVVVIGGGFGGATAARYLRLFDPDLAVTLVEPSRTYVTGPMSNMVIAGLRRLGDLTQGYTTLARRHGVEVMADTAAAVDADKHTVRLAGGQTLRYDRLIVSPGIDMRWNAIQGYDQAAAERMPHAWTSGEQILLLRRQLEAMPDGGVFLISAPPSPYRCPPAPYERASLVAYYFKQKKPRSKILILDSKDGFSGQPLFETGWKALYPGMIERIPLSNDGQVTEARPAEMTLVSDFGEPHKGDVINVIPPQQAGLIARAAGLANEAGWCPVDPTSFESTIHKDIHVIGDAAQAGAMPKGAFAANSQAKVAALAIADALNSRPAPMPTYVSSCYSLLAPDYGLSVIDIFRNTSDGIMPVAGAGGTSPLDADAAVRAREARYALGWYASITREIWQS